MCKRCAYLCPIVPMNSTLVSLGWRASCSECIQTAPDGGGISPKVCKRLEYRYLACAGNIDGRGSAFEDDSRTDRAAQSALWEISWLVIRPNALQSVRYYPNSDRTAYYIEVETGWIGKPDLKMPDEFWRGTGYTMSLKPTNR